MKFLSTRDAAVAVEGAEAIVKGISDEGGLFVPESFPAVTISEIEAMRDMDYPARAAAIIGKFLPELANIGEYTSLAAERFDGDPAPLVKLGECEFVLELWHGPTHAFKDMALTLLPYLMTGCKKLLGRTERTLILTATSGDTGKAALEGFRDVAGTDVIVFYPSEGVSELQKLQMISQRGSNVEAAGIRGNFDDAQTAVKKIFVDPAAKAKLAEKGYAFGSANSINFGRLVPQIAYYFSAYVDLLDADEIKAGDKVNFCVPTGNFGNILACLYAKKMGLPVGKLVCASNRNRVLTDFIATGRYDKNRTFYKTTSPSMDILVSSNLERLIFELSGRDHALTARRMRELSSAGHYEITAAEKAALERDFLAGSANDEEVRDEIADIFEDSGYLADPHTAVAFRVYEEVAPELDGPTVIVSTASPYKFADTVLEAIGGKRGKDETETLARLEEETALPLPESLSELPGLPRLHEKVIDKEEALSFVLGYADGKSAK